MLSAKIQLIQQSQNDIDDIDINTADPTFMKRYRVDIESISTISTAIQLIQQEHDDIDDIDSNTVDTTVT